VLALKVKKSSALSLAGEAAGESIFLAGTVFDENVIPLPDP
jgi:hypothetical protein